MTRLLLHRACANHHCLQHAIVQTEQRLRNSIVAEEETPYVLLSLIISYMLNLVICIGILLDLL
jgi:hypothetical protein